MKRTFHIRNTLWKAFFQGLVTVAVLSGSGTPLGSQVPFTCRGQVFLTMQGSNELVEAVVSPGNNSLQISSIGNPGISLFALGFRSADRLLYGIGTPDLHLYRIDATGKAYDAGKPNLDGELLYLAGDVSPDGKHFLAVGSLNGVDKKLVRINLESGNLETEVFPLPPQLHLSDIAFDPYTSQLYGYDRLGRRLVTFTAGAPTVTAFPALAPGNELYGVHFDAFGNLFSVGATAFGVTNALFSLDKTHGKEKVLTNGPPYAIADAASCPYTIKFNNQATPAASFPCSEINYHYSIANNTGKTITGIDLEHALPPGLGFTNIVQNPLGATPDAAALPGVLRLNNLTIPNGIHQVLARVEIADIPGGNYRSQAWLKKLPAYLGGTRFSDDPLTVAYEDSTTLKVTRFEEDSLFFSWFLCHGKTLVLDASDYGNNVQWSTGSKELQLTVTQGGTYTLEAASGCQTLFVSHEVTSASCPYTIAFSHKILPDTAFPCSELLYRFVFNNDSGEERKGVNFSDTLPEGFTFRALLRNPYGGTVHSAFPSKTIRIEGMALKMGLDTLDLLVEAGDLAPGNYPNRAMIDGLSQELGPRRWSNNGKTNAFEATPVHILGVDADTLFLEATICAGTSLVLDAGEYGVNHLWQDGSTGSRLTVNAAGTFKVTIFDGCEPSAVYFTVKEGPFIDVSFPQVIVPIHLGEQFTLNPLVLNASDSVRFEWSDPLGNSLSCRDCYQPVATPFENVSYLLSVSNGVCSDTATVAFGVDASRRVYAPNVFSPNADGINDFFFLQSPDYGLIRSLLVFDRWGGVVFYTTHSVLNDWESGWDGRQNGKDLPSGVYLWRADITFIDGKTETFRGDILMLH